MSGVEIEGHDAQCLLDQAVDLFTAASSRHPTAIGDLDVVAEAFMQLGDSERGNEVRALACTLRESSRS
jgi:hypothetical protein